MSDIKIAIVDYLRIFIIPTSTGTKAQVYHGNNTVYEAFAIKKDDAVHGAITWAMDNYAAIPREEAEKWTQRLK